jgi:hypothetical protein
MEVEILFIVLCFDKLSKTKNKKIATDSRKKLLKILTRAQRTDAVNKFRIKKAPNYFDAQI